MKEKHKEVVAWMLSLSRDQVLHYMDGRLWKITNRLREMGYTMASINEKVMAIFRLFVSADLSCNPEEFEIFKTITGIQYSAEQFFNMTNRGRDEKFLLEMSKWLTSLDSQLFTDIFTFGTYIMTIDGPLADDEIKVVEYIDSIRPL